MLALLLPPIFGSLRKRKLWIALLAGTLLAVMALAGCGDSKKITPYAITVTATATPNTNGVVQHSTNVTLDVR
jgi:predicted component of type VI protein secretion system